MKFWPRYPGDWKKKTAALSLLEKGVYSEMLDFCYSTEQPLPSDPKRIWALVGAQTETEKHAVDTVLKMFFVKNGKGWENQRVMEELAKWQEKSTKASASAKKRWSAAP